MGERIYCHLQTDCFVLSELFSVARHAGRSKPGSKPVQFCKVQFFVFFFIILMTPSISDTMAVLNCQFFFSISIYWSSYLFYFTLWLICYYLLALTYQFEGSFFFIVLSHNICFISVYFTVTFESKVPENSMSFEFFHWFLVDVYYY